MTPNTKLEDWRERLMDEFAVMFERATREHEDGTEWVKKLEVFIAQERAQVVKECIAALPPESVIDEKIYPFPEFEKTHDESAGWNAYRARALDAFQKIAQEHD